MEGGCSPAAVQSLCELENYSLKIIITSRGGKPCSRVSGAIPLSGPRVKARAFYLGGCTSRKMQPCGLLLVLVHVFQSPRGMFCALGAM